MMEPTSIRHRITELNAKAYYLLVALSFIYRTNPARSLQWALTLTALVAVLPVQDYVESERLLARIRFLKVACLTGGLFFTLWFVWMVRGLTF